MEDIKEAGNCASPSRDSVCNGTNSDTPSQSVLNARLNRRVAELETALADAHLELREQRANSQKVIESEQNRFGEFRDQLLSRQHDYMKANSNLRAALEIVDQLNGNYLVSKTIELALNSKPLE